MQPTESKLRQLLTLSSARTGDAKAVAANEKQKLFIYLFEKDVLL